MKQKELTQHAVRYGVTNSTIDKDWVQSHILNAIYDTSFGKDLLVFKGGTCLRKCWIENYRFSEDLDFTLLDPTREPSIEWINSVFQKANYTSAAQFHLESLRNQIWKNIPQGYLLEIKFWGADHHPNQRPLPHTRWQTMIHIDINHTEPLLDIPVSKTIIHPYSDATLICNKVRSYSLVEILAEKIRSLQQRNRPRDIYDVEMLRKLASPSELKVLKELFVQKCLNKSLEYKDPKLFVNPEKQRINAKHWERGLKHQISQDKLPDFNSLYRSLSEFIDSFLRQM